MEYIEPGTAITIHGLNARPDLNGLNGVVLNYIPARERYHVKVFAVGDGAKEEEEIFLRPTNCSKKKDDDEENGRKRKESTTNEKEERAEMAASTKVAKVGTTEEEHGQTKEEREEKRAIENATLFEDDTTQTTTTTTTTTTKKVEKIEELKDDETLLKEFFKDVSQTDRASEVDRILSCFKLNPYEYLNVRFDATIQEVAKSFRKVSLLVHPDKCNHPKASVAFDAIGQAQKVTHDS